MKEGGKGGSGRGRDVCVGEGGWGKIGKESRLSPVIRGGGIPVWRGGCGWVRRGEGRLGFIDKKGGRGEKGRLCLASRESRQLSVLIRAAQYCED